MRASALIRPVMLTPLAAIPLIGWGIHANIPQPQPPVKAPCAPPHHARRSAAPSAALSAIYQKNIPVGGQEALRSLLKALAETDPTAALSWARSINDGYHRAYFEEVVLQSVAENDPPKAVGLLMESDGDELREYPLLEQLVARWATDDPSAALAWVCDRHLGETRERLVSRCAFAMAGTHPDDAARLIAEEMVTGPRQDEAAIAVLHQWILHDPASARRWVDRFPPSDLRTRAEDEFTGNPSKAAP